MKWISRLAAVPLLAGLLITTGAAATLPAQHRVAHCKTHEVCTYPRRGEKGPLIAYVTGGIAGIPGGKVWRPIDANGHPPASVKNLSGGDLWLEHAKHRAPFICILSGHAFNTNRYYKLAIWTNHHHDCSEPPPGGFG